MSKIAIYPGTFDPITNGHLDIVQRACKLFDGLIIAVAKSENKKPLFSQEQRIEMAELAIKELQLSFPSLYVYGFDNLVADFA